uniref:WH2 domain-containing protein n=1 Tax=Macrostomum lignano TaxID=282301 RepID=A0A1I8FI87_9PLAT
VARCPELRPRALPAAPASSSRRSRVGGGSRSKRDSIRSGVAGSHRRLRLDEIDDAVPCTTAAAARRARSGIEALHRVITDLETSLESFDGLGDVRGGAASESELLTELRQLLETAYSIRERAKQRALDVDEAYLPSTDVSDEDGDSDADSFVSALEQLDISDLDDQKRQASDNAHLYRAALLELEHGSVPFRKLRTANLGCSTDTEYLARLHCIRLAMDQLMADRASANWFRVTGRELGALLLDRLGCDVQPSWTPPTPADAIRRDLEPRGVRVFGLYDIAFDYMLLDAFEELASPPPSIVSVLQNRWLSAGFKRTALDS